MHRETRLAIVMNGGVSLAVWMGGVTHEINRARMATLGQVPTRPEEAAVHEAWRAVLAAADRGVVVDTIAGTSAGGLNGTVLATTIGRGCDLPDMKEVWSSVASLEPGALLRSDPDGARSVFSGDYFRDRVDEVLASIVPSATPAECTLLVTATALGGPPTATRLEQDQPALSQDSRRVYRFRRLLDADEQVVVDDFAPVDEGTGPGPAVQAARASAGFPVAFDPIWETPELKAQRVSSDAPPPSWLMDGGVLDNAPFEPLLDALRIRPVHAPFERVILYVTPSVQAQSVTTTGTVPPDAIQTLGSVLKAIREPDQRSDIETLCGDFGAMGYTIGTPHDVLARYVGSQIGVGGDVLLGPTEAVAVAERLYPLYRHGRAEAAERQLLARGLPPSLVPPGALQLHVDLVATMPGSFVVAAGAWPFGWKSTARILRWWGRALALVAQDDAAAAGTNWKALFDALGIAQRQAADGIRAYDQALDARVADLGPAATADARLAAYLEVLDAQGVPAAAHATLQAFHLAVVAVLPGTLSADMLLSFSASLEVVASVMSWTSTGDGDDPAYRYWPVTPGVAPLLDVGPVAGNEDWSRRKLYGEKWNHFGAFSTEPGRRHDWLWGRLDGASALCQLLVGPGYRDDPLCQAVADAILTADGTDLEALRDGASTAYETSGKDLLVAMAADDPVEEAGSLWLLVDTLPEVLGETGPVGDLPLGYLLELATSRNPTVSGVGRVGLRHRLMGRGLRTGATPLRWWAGRKIRSAYEA